MCKCVTVVHSRQLDDSLMMAPMECRNTEEIFLCICCAYSPEHLKLVLYIDFHTMQGIHNIKIETVFTVRYELRWKNQL